VALPQLLAQPQGGGIPRSRRRTSPAQQRPEVIAKIVG
jgi:hypothetical protein